MLANQRAPRGEVVKNGLSISVVISTLNRPQSLPDTIEGLLRQSYSPFEVIVVNGPSDDRTDRVLAQYRDLIHVKTCTDRNLSISRNIGIAAAQGDLIAFIDDDAVPYVHWLRDLAAGFDEPDVAAVGGFVFDQSGYDYQYRYSFCNRLARTRFSADPPRTDHCFPNAFEFPYLQGTNIAIRGDLLETIGGFDEEFAYSLDETDVCMRLIDAGYIVKQIENGFVYHRFLPSDVRDEHQVTKQWYPFVKSRVYFALKNLADINELPAVLQSCLDEITLTEQHLAWLEAQGDGQPGLLDRFRADAGRGLRDGLQRALFHPRSLRDFTPALALNLTDGQRRFVPCQTLTPAGRRLNICLPSEGAQPGPLGPVAGKLYAKARGLADLGHTVHVLVPAQGKRNLVEFDAGIWVHNLLRDPKAESPQGPPAVTEDWPSSDCVLREIRRINAMEPVDVVDRPTTGDTAAWTATDVIGPTANAETLAHYRAVVSGIGQRQTGHGSVKDLLRGLEFGADFKARSEQFAPIRGWLHPHEGYALLTLAEFGPSQGAVVEIGSYAGLSTAYLAFGAKRAQRERVTAIDHFRGSAAMQQGGAFEAPEIVAEGSSYGAFLQNLASVDLSDYVISIVSGSSAAASNWSAPIRLLFIDGDHSYQGSREDFFAFDAAISPGGVICFHDVGVKEGVTRFFHEFIATRRDYEHVATVMSLAIVAKDQTFTR